MSDVLVLGAGPTGLMAALDAATAGRSCTVLEASDRVGGMAGSFEVAGQRVDFGSHRLHPASPQPLLDQLGTLLGDDLQVRPRAGRLHLGGRWVGFPLRVGELVRRLPPAFAARLVADAGISTVRGVVDRRAPATFDDEIRARFGPLVADRFYGPYARKLYGVAPEELDVELAERRVSASSPIDIARRLVKATTPTGRTFLYPRRGYGQICEALADAAVAAGATIELNTAVTGVKAGADGVVVDTDGGGRHEAATALSTIPLPVLSQIVDPAPPADVVDALGRVRTRGMVLAYLVLDRPQYTPFDAHYLPGLETMTARLSEPKNYRDGDDPADTTVLCAEIACWPDDELWNASPDEVAGRVVDDLARLGLPDATPAEVELRHLRSVYPVYDRDTADARATIDDWTRTSGRLMTLGRQGLRVIDNLHHVLAMGSAAVASIDDDGAIDTARWHAHLDDFAAHTVED
ncbi:MAG: FAD-dependent oxidoreductase [Actinomycetota bacterium]